MPNFELNNLDFANRDGKEGSRTKQLSIVWIWKKLEDMECGVGGSKDEISIGRTNREQILFLSEQSEQKATISTS